MSGNVVRARVRPTSGVSLKTRLSERSDRSGGSRDTVRVRVRPSPIDHPGAAVSVWTDGRHAPAINLKVEQGRCP